MVTIDQESAVSETSGDAGPSPVATGRVVAGRYRIDALLGRGGMGEVWRARDLTLRTDVALKTAAVRHPRARERLRSEVLAARRVVSPNVCRVYDLFTAEGVEVVSMELIDGTTLGDLLLAEAPLPLRRAQEIASQLLSGLEQIHRAGLVHRDLTPANVMVTRGGRVVIMDFGLARAAEEESVTAAGTRPYMAPEQALGERLDGRADLYAAGMILAEMTAPGGVRDPAAQRALWKGARADPPQLPDTPWAPALRCALRVIPADRCASAAELLGMIEQIGRNTEEAEDLEPYPGLAAFTEADAKYFFGREHEIEQVWRRLDRPHLQALVGASGAGKTSLLRAGLAASAPPGWRIVVATPGNRPFANLARALAPELGGDAGAVDELLRFDEPAVATALVGRWRGRHAQALIVVDQFEELFTQNPPEVRARFADLLGRLPLEAQAHVLVAIRDDFFFRCAEHEPLAPLFSEPIPLRAPSGSSLRRALVEPAIACGYRFEDEALVAEIVGVAEGERGALPLMAFAAAQLWERRDRDRGLLTRASHDAIGGVAGALARHADATLERIGEERVPLVREIFRNLATAQGTRAARERGELLSVVPESERAAAGEVVAALVRARLLTAYDTGAGSRIEIVHESLLTHWPRLERWRTQDAEGAQLRDELRQAAQVWEQHGRADDFLWTGTAYREYQLWRERYPGGLTDLEETFGTAMTALAGRRKRRLRTIAAAAAIALLAVALALTVLWRRSVAEANRATAAELLAVGRMWLPTDRSIALACATESLRRADSPEARRFAVRVLWEGAQEFVSRSGPHLPLRFRFSPGGEWLGIGYQEGQITILPKDGGRHVPLGKIGAGVAAVAFSDDGTAALGWSSHGEEFRTWSVAAWEPLRTIRFERRADTIMEAFFGATPGEVITLRTAPDRSVLYRWDGTAEPVELGSLPTHTLPSIDARTGRVVAGYQTELRLYALKDLDGPFTTIGRHRTPFQWNGAPAVDPGGRFVVAADPGGEIVLWSLDSPGRRLRTLEGMPGVEPMAVRLSNDGGRLCVSFGREVRVWDLTGVAGAEPVRIPIHGPDFFGCDMHPNGEWLAMRPPRGPTEPDRRRTSLWHISPKRIRVFRGHVGGVEGVAFSPDGRWVYSLGDQDGKVIRWPLDAAAGERETVVLQRERMQFGAFSVDRLGRFLLARFGNGVWKIPFDDGAPVRLTDIMAVAASVDPGGRFLAVAPGNQGMTEGVKVLELETGVWRDVGPRRGAWWLDFDARGRLVFTQDRKLKVWDPATDRIAVLSADADLMEMFPDGRRALVLGDATTIVDLESGTSERAPRQIRPLWPLPPVARGGVTARMVDLSTIGVGSLTDPSRTWLLSGHDAWVADLAISPDGRWVAAGTADALYLWPMPDFREPPLNELPLKELIAKLESLTNVRIHTDVPPAEATAWVDDAAYHGWKEAPEW